MFGKQVRLGRITKNGRMLCIPMDHSFTIGPVAGLENPEEMVAKVAKGGATAFLVHKGIIKADSFPASCGSKMIEDTLYARPVPTDSYVIRDIQE